MANDLKCPICGSVAKPLDKTGDADGFDCPKHGRFKVGGTTMATKTSRPCQEWESALDRAKNRTKPDEWPMIKNDDFDRPNA
jgi:hypothetical protein